MADDTRDPTTRVYGSEPRGGEGLTSQGGGMATHPHDPGVYEPRRGGSRHMMPVILLAIALLVLVYLLFARI